MSQFCPLLKEKVLYTACLECEDKQVCKQMMQKEDEKEDEETNTTKTKSS